MTKTKLQMCKSAGKKVKGLAGMKDLSATSLAILTKAISRYTTVRFVFDQYSRTTSLKQTTRERHKSSTGRTSYTCKCSTPIRMSLMVFLSESKTKDSLTLYLAQKHSIISGHHTKQL